MEPEPIAPKPGMAYGRILADSVRLLWQYKPLWLLGLLANVWRIAPLLILPLYLPSLEVLDNPFPVVEAWLANPLLRLPIIM